jgi:hypothetical protein
MLAELDLPQGAVLSADQENHIRKELVVFFSCYEMNNTYITIS